VWLACEKLLPPSVTDIILERYEGQGDEYFFARMLSARLGCGILFIGTNLKDKK